MSRIENFQTNNSKNDKDRYNVYDSNFESPVGVLDEDFISKNLDKWMELTSFLRFYPDYYYDLIKPKTGKKFNFDVDQRVMMRVLARFPQNYMCIPRGGSKTLVHIMEAYSACHFFPGITMSVLASTKQSAVEIWEEKHDEIMTFFPYMRETIKSAHFSKDKGRVEFVNGSIIDNLANTNQSKGRRRRRGGLEEENLIDKDTYEDAIAPIFNVPRKTMTGDEDPEELNGRVCRFTTSGYKNSDSYETIIQHLKDMLNLNGSFVYTSDWCVPVHFGRQKMSVVNNARKGSSTRFKQNYLCDWVGSTDGSLINISKIMKARTLKLLENFYDESKGKKEKSLPEYAIGIDVARKSNNRTAIVVGKIIRSDSGKIRQIQIVNIITPPYNLSYTEQAIIIKNVYLKYGGNKKDIAKSRVKAVIIDANSWGQGLVEKLLEDNTDPETNEELGCWDTINSDDKPEVKGSIKILYALMSQGVNKDVIRIFVDCFESNKVKLITTFENLKGKIKTPEDAEFAEDQCKQVVDFIDEVANLKIKETENKNNITIQQVTKATDKDRYSAAAYLLYYIINFMDNEDDDTDDWGDYAPSAKGANTRYKTENYY